ncbi:unnamed protein product [Ectocarpus sp. 12 AP-2014]
MTVRLLYTCRLSTPGRSGQGWCGCRSESLLPIGVRDHSRIHASPSGRHCWLPRRDGRAD